VAGSLIWCREPEEVEMEIAQGADSTNPLIRMKTIDDDLLGHFVYLIGIRTYRYRVALSFLWASFGLFSGSALTSFLSLYY
jgi:hypothetical protein